MSEEKGEAAFGRGLTKATYKRWPLCATLSLVLTDEAAGSCSPSDIAGGVRDPPSLCQEGKRKLTESAREFPKASSWQRPEGSLQEARKRREQ